MDVDRLTSHTFAALAHGFDLNEIVVVGWEAELSSGSVGRHSKDVIVAMSLQHHLRQRGSDSGKWANANTNIIVSGDKSQLCKIVGLTKYPVTFDSVSMATTGFQCSVSVEPIMFHCMLSGGRSGATKEIRSKYTEDMLVAFFFKSIFLEQHSNSWFLLNFQQSQ